MNIMSYMGLIYAQSLLMHAYTGRLGISILTVERA